MNLDQFLREYVPGVLRPMGGWVLVKHGAIRRSGCCPLTAEVQEIATISGAGAQAARLGLSSAEAALIINGADWPTGLTPAELSVRDQLLAGLALEPQIFEAHP